MKQYEVWYAGPYGYDLQDVVWGENVKAIRQQYAVQGKCIDDIAIYETEPEHTFTTVATVYNGNCCKA